MAFINLVQATELLMKEAIAKVSPSLLQVNIDTFHDEDKTINFIQCISRLIKFTELPVTEEEINHLKNCAKSRNAFTHFKVDISTEKIKKKYSNLFLFYDKLYLFLVGVEISFKDIDQYSIEYIITFAKRFTIFRGYEIL